MPTPTPQELRFRMAVCVLAGLELGVPANGYESLKDFVADRQKLVGALKKVGFPDASDTADAIAEAVNGIEKEWKVTSVRVGISSALILSCGDEAGVYFPGTPPPPHGLRMWGKDLEAIKAQFTTSGGRPCGVHHGFLDMYERISDLIQQKLYALQDEHKDIHVTISGYSAGGAMGMLLALGLETGLKENIQSVCTYAAPHIGNSAFAEAVNIELGSESNPADKVCHVSDGDLVTYIPPWFQPTPGKTIDISTPYPDTMSGRVKAGVAHIRPSKHYPMAYFIGLETMSDTLRPAHGGQAR